MSAPAFCRQFEHSGKVRVRPSLLLVSPLPWILSLCLQIPSASPQRPLLLLLFPLLSVSPFPGHQGQLSKPPMEIYRLLWFLGGYWALHFLGPHFLYSSQGFPKKPLSSLPSSLGRFPPAPHLTRTRDCHFAAKALFFFFF